MSEAVSILMTARGLQESRTVFDILSAFPIPNEQKLLYSDVKFDDQGLVIRRNLEGSYPTATAELHSVSLAIQDRTDRDAYYHAGYILFCLDNAINTKGAKKLIAFTGRNFSVSFNQVLEATKQPSLFTYEKALTTLDGEDARTKRAIADAATLFRTGAALSLADHSIGHVLELLSCSLN